MFVKKIIKTAKKAVKKTYPKVLLTLPIKRPFSIGPIIFIPRNLKGSSRSAIIKHEETHWKQNKWKPWKDVQQVISKSERWKREKEAYTNQIRYLQSIRKVINYDAIVDQLNSGYNHMAPYEEIKAFVYWLRDTNPYRR